jgi:cation diffusion facilitator CzcD-associated flavoprotein CzcO
MTGIRDFDRESVYARYQRERDKRMVKGRAEIRDLTRDGWFARYRKDPFTPWVSREPISDEVEVAIIGAGMSGVVVGAKLREVGLSRVRLIDQAGGIGGTWYWNRYPGVMCDVESYIYMPMLEELGYIPKTRYAFGEEIRAHLEAIAKRYGLVDDALFHTGVQKSEWDESSSRWVVRTDRGDEIRSKYLIMAVGILNLMKLPVIPGMERFKGRSFHTARWDYEYTGGSPTDWHNLGKLGDKVVAVVGTGASAIQCIPPLAESSRHLYVFQRTPSAVGVRGNRPTDEAFVKSRYPGWQRQRMENFSAVMLGRQVDRDLVDDGWTHHFAKLMSPKPDPAMSPESMMQSLEELDYAIMDEHRSRVDEIVSDPRTAEILKPYYRYLCKRPCFHDEYLPAFNLPNVTLIDCPAGVERVTEHGLIANGTEYEVDCIVYATGFEAEVTPFPRRAGHPIIGRDGVHLSDKWRDGVISLYGMMTRGFPNMFIMPAPGQQAVVTVNITHLNVQGAEHIAKTVALLEKRGVKVFDVSSEAEADWTQKIVSGFVDSSAFMAACTPSRLNFEGNPGAANPRNGTYGGGPGDVFAYCRLLAEWRERGDFVGLELDEGAVQTQAASAGSRRSTQRG